MRIPDLSTPPAHDAAPELSQPAAEVSEVIRAAKQILLESRVRDFSGADVVAVARMILAREEKNRAHRA